MTLALPPSGQKFVRFAVTGALLVAALAGGRSLIAYYQADPWTRDGRIRADIVQVAPDVPGLVTQVYVTHDQAVHKGDPLFQIDPSRFDLAIGQAAAQVTTAQADVLRAQALITRAKATLGEARREATRNAGLGDLVAAEATQQSQTHASEAAATLADANAAKAEAQAKLAAAHNALDLARLNRARTRIVAPMDGILSDLNLRVGNYVGAGAPVLALIDTSSLRVEGYFEETKLPHIRIGQSATIRLMGEDKVLTGHVISLAAAIEDHDRIGSPHLLPAINPTFSWVRLAQRVPVRIRLDAPPAQIALIAGRTASVSLTPDTRK
jgi:multidrug resistance efflux pump